MCGKLSCFYTISLLSRFTVANSSIISLVVDSRKQTTVVDLLSQWRRRKGGETAFLFLADGETEAGRLTFAELDRNARRVAASLQQRGIQGERVLLLYPPGLDYICAFLGCLYAGAVAVPAYPPRSNRGLDRLRSVAADSQPALALTSADLPTSIPPVLNKAPQLKRLQLLASDRLTADPEDWKRPKALEGDRLAFLQYTSGSTAAPKGVMVSHANILCNEVQAQQALGHASRAVLVGWLPLYHHMGLIGNVLQPLFAGIPSILMPPLAFLQQPLRWLQAISSYRATTSGGSNFAYDLCARKITPEQARQLDLSSWKAAFNGAEPVDWETLERFSKAFRICGFDRRAFCPCYGLAEASLFVSGGSQADPPVVGSFQQESLQRNRVLEATPDQAGNCRLVGCGRAWQEGQIRIVDPQSSAPCAPGEVGEIWVSGPHVAYGYWNRPQQSERTFQAFLKGGEGPFLRSGDLGFMDGDELFITGRLKDLIIIGGLSYYPQDIERTAQQSHIGLRAGGGAAFSVQADGRQGLVVVHEIERRFRNPDVEAVARAIRKAVSEAYQVQVEAVALLHFGSLPRTSSGKVRRRDCRQGYLSGALREMGRSVLAGVSAASAQPAKPSSFILGALAVVDDPQARRSLLKEYLQEQTAKALRISASGLDGRRPLSSMGLDSLSAVELSNALQTDLGIGLPLHSLLEEPNINLEDLTSGLLEQLIKPPSKRQLPIPSAGVPPRGSFPLSCGQRALWFLHQVEPDSTAYHIAGAIRFEASLDGAALRHCLQELVDRHPALRTTFSHQSGLPVQAVREEAPVQLEQLDASDWSPDLFQDRLVEEAHRPFDLQRYPLLRITLLRRSPGESVLLLVVHHIVADLWSLQVLLRELVQLYTSLAGGTPAKLPPLPLHYADYVRWQAEWLSEPRGQRLWAFWEKRLQGNLPVLSLPTDRPRPPQQSYRGRSFAFHLDRATATRLDRLGTQCGATLFMTLASAYLALLQRWTGQEEILLGVPTAGRDRAELAGLVGYFVNPVVLRTDLCGDPSFGELCQRTRQTALEAFRHRDYPFPLLVERLQPERDASRSPLFQTMLALQQTPLSEHPGFASIALGEEGPPLMIEGLSVRPVALPQQAAQFDLRLTMARQGESLLASLQYNSDLFDTSTIIRLASHFKRLCRSCSLHPGQPVSRLPLLSEAERQQLAQEWNDTQREYPSDQVLHQLFHLQAVRRPDASALVFENHWTSYQALNSRASQLAHRLREMGVAADCAVGLALQSGPEMVIGQLGCLKAGGAYLPLDTFNPADRLAFMLEDAGCKVLLTGQGFSASSASSVREIRLDAQWADARARPADPAGSNCDPSNLAYVIYTSGSTGRPKGVAVSHRAVSRLVLNADYVRLDSSDCLSQASNVAFDVSSFEIWGALLHGARLALVSRETKLSAARLASFFSHFKVSLVNLTPALFNQVVLEEPRAFRGLRSLLLAGEALDPAPVRRVLSADPPLRLLNVYGPTENATFSTWHQVKRVPKGASNIPIGRPIANSLAFVVDRWLEPVPLGLCGELALGGDGLARGYLQRPGLTARSFLPDPIGKVKGARLYMSGDSARWRRDGEIEFLGRLDHQVKIRGFRVELGEIEERLVRHPSIRQAVVATDGDGAGSRRLTAYLVARDRPGPPVGELRRFLKQALPDYMVPSAFIELEAMPLTPNGKVDRKALPKPASGRPRLGKAMIPPRSAAEAKLAEIWRQVLGLEQVGVEDNFFELGGDSILSIQVVSRANQAGLKLTAKQALRYQTIAGLAAQSGGEQPIRSRPDPSGGSPFPLARISRAQLDRLPGSHSQIEDLYPLAPTQQGLLFHSLYQPGRGEYVVQLHCRLEGRLDRDLLQRAWSHAVQRHPALRTSFLWEELEEPLQAVHPSLAPLWEELDWSEPADLQEERLQAKLQSEREKGFDPSRPPLTRLSLIRLGDQSHWMLWAFHHLILDGWSTALILREVFGIYQSLQSGRSPSLPLPRPFRDYLAWLQEQDLGRAEAFWRRRLEGWSAATRLTVDRPVEASTEEAGFEETATSLSEGATAALTALARPNRLTPSTLVQGAWALLLSRYSAEREVLFGLTVAGRPPELEGVESMAGLFINTLPFRVEIGGGEPLLPWLQKLQESQQELRLYEYTPLVQIQKWSGVPSGQPLFESIVIFENYPLGLLPTEEKAGGLKVREVGSLEWTHYPLCLTALPGRELRLEISWDARRFEAPSVTRMLGHLKTLLQGMARDAQQPLACLPLLLPSERQQLLLEWNDTVHRRRLPEPCVHDVVASQADLQPDAVAVEFEDRFLSYGEANRRADDLAGLLGQQGARPESVVALCLNRCPEAVIGLLAIFKSGAVYLPLDPGHPAQRLAAILETAGAQSIFTRDHFEPRLKDCPIPRIFESALPASGGRPRRSPRVHPQNAAYVIYTSGSTGNPKGVVVPHRALGHFVKNWSEAIRISPRDRLLQFASLSFDTALEETFSALTSGATLVLRDEAMLQSNLAFLRRCCESSLTVVDLPTAFWHQLMGDLQASSLKHLPAWRTLIVGGERAIPEQLEGWLEQSGGRPLFMHAYGPTEATVACTLFRVPREWRALRREVPIGRPLNGCQTYLLDSALQPVCAGVCGHLHIGGSALARGYLASPGLTASCFIPDPFGESPGARLYRTGDLACWLSDGKLEFRGRFDGQVKLRGFRIETGEIEARLCRHPYVHEAAVALREDQPGAKRLVAYIVASSEAPQPLSSGFQTQLRRYLEKRLPDYMVPAFFVCLDALPLTPGSCKLDRRALPAPQDSRPQLQVAYTAPRTSAEARLAEIWSQVLGLKQVGVEDNFFELGGDSILSIQVAARASQAGLGLTPKQLFDHPTIAGLALVAEVKASPQGEAPQGLVQGKIPLTPIQHWFFEEGFEGLQHWNQAVLLQLKESRLAPPVLEKALEALLLHHDALRLRFRRTGGGWRQFNQGPERVSFVRIDHSRLAAQQQRQALEGASAALQAGLDLGRGPLLRTALFEGGPLGPARFFIAIHHLAVDGVSWRILLEDLHTACRQMEEGGEISLPAKTTSYQQWARDLTDYSRSQALEKEEDYWRLQLSMPAEALPTDMPQGLNSEASARSWLARLDREDTRALLQDTGQAYGNQINDILLAALTRTLAGWIRNGSVRIDLEGHGREELLEEADLSRTVGWFTSVFPLVLHLDGNLEEELLLKSVKEQLRAVPKRGIGYGLLRYLRPRGPNGPEQHLEGRTKAQLSFNYLGQFDQVLPESSPFQLAADPCGPYRSPRANRSYLIEVDARVTEARLQVEWKYGSAVHGLATIQALADNFNKHLKSLISHCVCRSQRGYTPSDFPQMSFDQKSLDEVVSELAGAVEDLE